MPLLNKSIFKAVKKLFASVSYLLPLPLIATTSVPAQAMTFYVGGGAGGANFYNFCNNSSAGLCDGSGNFAQVYGGLKFHEHYAVQLSASHIWGLETPYYNIFSSAGKSSASLTGVSLLRFVPIANNLSFYGGIATGISSIDEPSSDRNSAQQSEIIEADEAHKDDPYWRQSNDPRFETRHSDAGMNLFSTTYGGLLGVEVMLNKDIQARVQWQRWYAVNGNSAFAYRSNLDIFSINFAWVF